MTEREIMTERAQPQPGPGLEIDFLEWKVDLLPGVSVELVELVTGTIDLSEIYIKPGTILELDDVELLESKIAL